MLSAAYFGHSDVCELFLEACGDVEERHPDTLFTPLHYAARYGQEVRNHVRIAGGVRPLRLRSHNVQEDSNLTGLELLGCFFNDVSV